MPFAIDLTGKKFFPEIKFYNLLERCALDGSGNIEPTDHQESGRFHSDFPSKQGLPRHIEGQP